MRRNDFMTTNPRDKYAATRPAPRAPPTLPTTAAPRLNPHARSVSRSPSPAPSWRRFFRRDRCPTPEPEPRNIGEAEVKPRAPSPDDDARSAHSCGTARSRDISPESLRRFLCDDPGPQRAPAVIPEAEEDEEGDDDENFADAAGAAWGTVLAPPPVKRAVSAPEVVCSPPTPHLRSVENMGVPLEESPVLPDFGNRSRFSFSSVSSCESDAGTPFWGVEGEGRGSYELPSAPSGAEKRVGGVVGVEGDLGEDLAWMVDVIKS